MDVKRERESEGGREDSCRRKEGGRGATHLEEKKEGIGAAEGAESAADWRSVVVVAVALCLLPGMRSPVSQLTLHLAG